MAQSLFGKLLVSASYSRAVGKLAVVNLSVKTYTMLKIQTLVCNPFRQNTYILYDQQRDCVVIDPGFYGDKESQSFWNFIQEQDLQIRQIWLTHAHLDHIFGLNELVAKTQLVPVLHSLEQEILDYAAVDALGFGCELQSYTGNIAYIEAGDVLHFAGNKVEVLHSPGHSPGSVVFYFPVQGFAFVGDVLFRESIGRTDLRGSSHVELMHSIHSKLLTLPPSTKIYAGHGLCTSIEHELAHNPFLR